MKKLLLCYMLLVSIPFAACEKFLNVKPVRSLAIPTKLADLQAILDNESRISTNVYPESGDIAADFFYLTDQVWSSRKEAVRERYRWASSAETGLDWKSSYLRIFDTNVVLDYVDKVDLGEMSEAQKDHVKGGALFFRAWNYLHLAQLFAPAYEESAANRPLGVPLQLSADINEPVFRSTLRETYQRIIDDFKASAELLPARADIPLRPDAAAAYAALARVYLWMADYESALEYTDLVLGIDDTLSDYNTIDRTANTPFDVFNTEVLFHVTIRASSGVFIRSSCLADTSLVASYMPGDLRLPIFFTQNSKGDYQFKGDYSGNNFGSLFCGLALDEVFLTKAESLARLGRMDEALDVMNHLLSKRWATDHFVPIQVNETDDVLQLIIDERRKELAFRGGIRWGDLKRLNLDTKFATELKRTVNGQTYRLPPNDPRYQFLIPEEVIALSGINQNAR